MNIFTVSSNVIACAKALDDKRLNKMILETAQILCTVYNEREGHQVTPYRSSHVNHPITQWAISDADHRRWLYRLGIAYGVEIEYRFDRSHSSFEVITQLGNTYHELEAPYEPIDQDDYYNGAKHSKLGLDFTHLSTFKAYRAYLSARWPNDKRQPKWTRRGRPKWA